MILLQRWSGRIMSEPLGKIFSTRTHYFRKKNVSAKKNLKFLSLVFWKINLSKLTLFFQIFHVILKLMKQLTYFSNFWTLKKKNTRHFFYNFQNSHERIKDF